jgi:hypothetical protein
MHYLKLEKECQHLRNTELSNRRPQLASLLLLTRNSSRQQPQAPKTRAQPEVETVPSPSYQVTLRLEMYSLQ